MGNCCGQDWDQARYMADQCAEVQRHKWIESEKAGKDLGPAAIMDWISKHAAGFRSAAEGSGSYYRPGRLG
jgi:hypothetical protein